MTYAGIEITDTDSLMAAADLIEDAEAWITCPECDGAREITDYSPDAGWINIECPCCQRWGAVRDTDPDDFDPEPPAPAAPAVLPCRECAGSGTRRYSVGFGLSDWIEEACSWCAGSGRQPAPAPACPACAGTGTDHLAGDASPAPFDRVARCGGSGQTGGLATVARYGVAHMRAIGTAGARVTIARHGLDYWRGLVSAKGWSAPRKPDLLSDLAAGRALADLDRAA
jgi:hypothetical protein